MAQPAVAHPSESVPSLSRTVRTMQAPARMTSARLGWSPTTVTTLLGVARAVELDLPVDLGPVEHRPVHDVRVVVGQPVADRGEVGQRRRPCRRAGRVARGRRGGRARRRSPPAPGPAPPSETTPSSPNRSVKRTAPTGTLNCSSTLVTDAERELRAAAAGVEDDERPGPASPTVAARTASRASSSPGDDLDEHAGPRPGRRRRRRRVGRHPQPGRPDGDDLARRPVRSASSAMSAIASTVRRIGSGWIGPPRWSPSPSRVTSARSTTVRQSPSASRSPTWNFTELVPTSITAYRRTPKPTSAASPRA